MARAGRRFVKFILFLVILVVVAAIALNLFRLKFDPPVPEVASVVRLHNAFVDFYGARSGTRILIFDAGADPLGRSLEALCASYHASKDEVTDVFLTHGHPDHLAAASLASNAKIHVGAKDAPLVDKSDLPWKLRLLSLLQPVGYVKPTDLLSGPTEINVGAGQTVRAIPLPGHTEGSYAYFWDGVLFVGDALDYREGQLRLPPPWMSEDPEAAKQAALGLGKTVKSLKIERICTGHGGCTPTGQAQKLLDDFAKRMQ
jgi:glyoxylase-like metal-dependent hydrolase (beta-lactamase superfamily II)